MNIEDVKVGTRVVCLNDSSGVIPKGAFGIVIEDGDDCPSVSWEKLFSKEQYNHMGYSNVYALMLNKIEKVSENFVPEKETAKLTVSVSDEDTNEIAKDILKIVLNDLNVIISDAIDSLELNNTESNSMQTDTNVVTEDSILTNLLNLIEKATTDGDLDSLLNLTTAYQRMKSASTI
jgi:hypothetical protein